MISLTSLPSLSDPPPVNPPATIASSRTWASAFAASKEGATGVPEGTLCFSAPLAEKLQIAATGTRAVATDDTVVHVLRLMGGTEEELEEWVKCKRKEAECRRKEAEEKKRRIKEERRRRIQELEAKGQTVAEGAA